MTDCKLCVHNAVCELWCSQESQTASCYSTDENKCSYYNGWFSVTERLPEDFVSVIIFIPSESPLPMVKEAYRANGCWATKMQIFFDEEVTHWMPLPEPPKEIDK